MLCGIISQSHGPFRNNGVISLHLQTKQTAHISEPSTLNKPVKEGVIIRKQVRGTHLVEKLGIVFILRVSMPGSHWQEALQCFHRTRHRSELISGGGHLSGSIEEEHD